MCDGATVHDFLIAQIGFVNFTNIPLWSNNSSSLAVSKTLTLFNSDEFIEGIGMVCSGLNLREVENTGDKASPQKRSEKRSGMHG